MCVFLKRKHIFSYTFDLCGRVGEKKILIKFFDFLPKAMVSYICDHDLRKMIAVLDNPLFWFPIIVFFMIKLLVKLFKTKLFAWINVFNKSIGGFSCNFLYSKQDIRYSSRGGSRAAATSNMECSSPRSASVFILESLFLALD